MFNYLYCDILGLMDPESLRQFLTGRVHDRTGDDVCPAICCPMSQYPGQENDGDRNLQQYCGSEQEAKP
jgi:hypothetical protein